MLAAAFHTIGCAVVAEGAGLTTYVFLVEIVGNFGRIHGALVGPSRRG